MASQRDVAFGRVALERQLVRQDHLQHVYAQLPANVTLRDALVRARLLTTEQADWIDAHLGGSAAAPTVVSSPADSTATVRPGASPADSTATVRPGASPADSTATVGLGGAALGSGSGVIGLPELGVTIENRYVLESVLGQGGMGAVYRARDLTRGEAVAVKVMLPDADHDGSALARFQREAEAVAKVDAHVGIVRIRAFGRHAGVLPYAVQDLVEGRDLHQIVKSDGPLPIDDALRLTEEVARAIAHCHGLGVLHRDLKPANVLRRTSDDTAHVTDFGLALDGGAERLTKTGEVMGTPAYMSPEQAEGTEGAVDHLTDVYALGAILYELVTGRPPFVGGPMQIMKRVFMDMPDPVAVHRADAPPEVDAICQMAMAKDREGRYASAGAFADDLAALRQGAPVAARPPSAWMHYRWRLGRLDAAAWRGLLVPFLLVGLLIIGGVWKHLESSPEHLLRASLSEDLPTVVVGNDPLALDARDPENRDRPTQVELLQSLAGWGKELVGEQPLSDTEFVRDAIAEARAKTQDDAFSRALALAEKDRSGTLALLDRLVARVGFRAGHGWQGSDALLEDGGEEAKVFKAMSAVRWGEPCAEVRGSSAQAAAIVSDLLVAKGLLTSVEPQRGDRSAEAAGSLMANVKRASSALADRSQRILRAFPDEDVETAWDPWSELMGQMDPNGEHLLHAVLLELKPRTLQGVVEGLVFPGTKDPRWKDRAIYRRLVQVTQALVAFTASSPQVDKQIALRLLLERVERAMPKDLVQLEGKGFSDLIYSLRKHLNWAELGDLSERVTRRASWALTDLLQRRAERRASDEETVQLLLIAPYFGIMPATKPFRGVSAELEQAGLWERAVERKPTGNGYLVWAQVAEILTTGEQYKDPRRLRTIAARYALALGVLLTDEEWSGLHLGPRPKQPPETEPLTPHWEPLARQQLAAIALSGYFDEAHRLDRRRWALKIEEPIWTLRLELGLEADQQLQALRYMVMHSRKLRLTLPPGEERSELTRRERRTIEAGVKIGWERLREQTDPSLDQRASTSDMQLLVKAALPIDTSHRLVGLIRYQADLLAEEGRSAEALALFARSEEQLTSLGMRDLPKMVEGLAELCLKLKGEHLDVAERQARKLVAIGEVLGSGGRANRTRSKACISSGTCLLAHVALERGDRAEAERIYQEDIDSGRSQRRTGLWNELEILLGYKKP